MEDEKLINHLSRNIQETLLMQGIDTKSDYVLKKMSRALIEDEKISINWRASGVKVVDHQVYPPIFLTQETKRIDNFSAMLDAQASMKKELDVNAPVDIITKFIHKDEQEITMIEAKALAFMICQIYKEIFMRNGL